MGDIFDQAAGDIFDQAASGTYDQGATAPKIGRPDNPIMQEIRKRATAGLAGVPGGAPQVAPATPAYQAAVGIPLAGAAAVMGGTTAMSVPALRWMATRGIAAAAIGQARKLPYVGPFIPPAAEMLPFFYQGGGLRGAAQAGGAVAAGEAATFAEGKIAKQAEALGRRPQPTPSPTTPPPTAAEPDMEMLRRQAGIRPEPAAPSAENTFMGELAKKKPVNLSELEAAGAKHETRTVEKAALERPKTEAERIQQEEARRGTPASDIREAFSSENLKGAVSEGFIDSAWKRIQSGKKILFSEKPGTLESRIQSAVDDGTIKSRADLAERVQQEKARRGQPPTATSGPKADLLEDKGTMERDRASLEADRVKAAQEYRANNTITTTKGELVQKAGTVKYTTTPPAPAKVDLNDPSTLQKLLKQSVKQAKARKR